LNWLSDAAPSTYPGIVVVPANRELPHPVTCTIFKQWLFESVIRIGGGSGESDTENISQQELGRL
jgi:hypothetical protein